VTTTCPFCGAANDDSLEGHVQRFQCGTLAFTGSMNRDDQTPQCITAEVARLTRERDEARARLAGLTDARLGNAVNEAARDLPSGWMVCINVENGSGEVILFRPSGVEEEASGSEDPLLSERVRLAVETANRKAKL